MKSLGRPTAVLRSLRFQASSQAAGSAGRQQHSDVNSTEAACNAAKPPKQVKASQQPAAAIQRAVARQNIPHGRLETPNREGTLQLKSRNKQKQTVQPQLVMAPFAGQQGPLVFNGDIRYAHNNRQAARWLNELLSLADNSPQPVMVGCDTETPATFVRGQTKKTALLQLCYHAGDQPEPTCLLIPVYRVGLPRQFLQLLTHHNIIKVGVGLTADMFVLQREYEAVADINIRGLFDLNWLAHACYTPRPPSAAKLQAMQQAEEQGVELQGWEEQWGLAGLLETVSEFSLVKVRRVQCSNWAQYPLTQKQIEYAAADAYAGLVVYHSLWLKWLQVQQQQEQQHERQQHDHCDAVGSRSTAVAAVAGRHDVDRGQDVLELLLDEVVDGSTWDDAAEVANTLTLLKQEHHAGQVQQPLVSSSGSALQQQPLLSQRQDQQFVEQATPKPASQGSADMQYTVSIQQLTSQHFWQGYKLANSDMACQRWDKEVLRPGLAAAHQLMQKLRANSVYKLEIAVLDLGSRLNWICSAQGTGVLV